MGSESDSDEITWNIVENTVSNRMKHNSLIHKLIPFRKLNCRTKVMNAEIKRLYGVKTYSQYIEIKTSILRNLSENTDTDDESCLSEDDYNVLHKPLISSNSTIRPAKKKRRIYSYEKDYEIDKNDIESEETSRHKLRKAKVKRHKVIKRNIENTFSESIEETNEDNFMCKDAICSQTIIGNNNKIELETLNSENRVSVTNEVRNISDSVNVNLQLLEQRYTNFLEETDANRNTAMNEVEHESSRTESSFICNKHEQKDSGIDEDTTSSVSPSVSDIRNKVCNENRNPNKAEFDKRQKCKLQPIVTCVTIIPNFEKYKIMCNVPLQDKHDNSSSKDLSAKETYESIGMRLQQSKNLNSSFTESESSFRGDKEGCSDVKNISDKVFERFQNTHLEIHDSSSNDRCGKKIDKIEDIEHSIENSQAIAMEKRLQKLKNLNLTLDSDSSLSEDEKSCSTEETMRDKVFRRSRELYDTSETEDESINIKHKVLTQFSENLQKDESISNKISDNFDEKDVNDSRTKENKKIRTIQDLIQEDDLVLQTPSFGFQDLEENEFFIMDIPSIALENQLIGNKMVLTQNMLELGGQKYRIDNKDIGNISCVFASANDKKSFEIGNIKPEMRVVVRERVT